MLFLEGERKAFILLVLEEWNIYFYYWKCWNQGEKIKHSPSKKKDKTGSHPPYCFATQMSNKVGFLK